MLMWLPPTKRSGTLLANTWVWRMRSLRPWQRVQMGTSVLVPVRLSPHHGVDTELPAFCESPRVFLG